MIRRYLQVATISQCISLNNTFSYLFNLFRNNKPPSRRILQTSFAVAPLRQLMNRHLGTAVVRELMLALMIPIGWWKKIARDMCKYSIHSIRLRVE